MNRDPRCSGARAGAKSAAQPGLVVRAALLGLAFLIAANGCGRKAPSPGAGVKGSLTAIGPFRIAVGNKPEPPAVGDNRLEVAVRDSVGAPVRGAEVTALVVMEAMGQMPRMESRGEGKETKPGEYELKYGISMAGEWDVTVRVRARDGSEAEARYRLSTSLRDLAFLSGTPPLGAHAPAAGDHRHPEGRAGEVAGAVTIDPARRQEIGIRTEPVGARDLNVTVRAAGRVTYDETRRAEVSLKFGGWVREIMVDYTGRPVRAGEALFTAYSPELFAAQQEYLTALGRPGGSSPRPADQELADAARQRLLLWDIAPREIDAIARAGVPMEAVPIAAPVSGIVLEKSVVRGSAFTAGQTLYKIAPIHPVWVVASVYQFELSLVKTGMDAAILTPFLGEKSRGGRVSWVSPYLETATRTGEVRIEVPNRDGDLKPGMFVDVQFQVPLGKRLAVPESAVLHVGDKKLVFVDLGDGRLAPREVTLGARAGDYFEARSGLQAGEIVVTSGNFLVAAESRLKSASEKW